MEGLRFQCLLCASAEYLIGFFSGVWFELEGVGLEAAVGSFFDLVLNCF